MILKILHICNNYVSSKVHLELIRSILSKGNISQFVYVPIRTALDDRKNFIDEEDIDFKYFNYKFNFLRFFPLIKIFIVFIGLMLNINAKKYSAIVAHNFWSDGVVAFLNFIFFRTPYILVVRNTDMNVFLPRLKHYHWLMRLMIKNSKSLIFVNLAYKKDFERLYPSLYFLAPNVKLIYNGVNEFWLDGFKISDRNRNNVLLYVGAFNDNKNLTSIVSASKRVHLKYNNLKLILVGGSLKELELLLDGEGIPDFIHVAGKVTDKSVLLQFYRESKIFIMPSFFETFGLVYIEALLQGCSIIHSKGQGIDGIFDEDFIKGVDPYSVDDIVLNIEYLLEQFNLRNDSLELYQWISNQFSWDNIADQYLRVMM